MEDNHGKEIKLVRTTVKIPGQRPRGSESTSSVNQTAVSQQANGHANKSLDSSKRFYFADPCFQSVLVKNSNGEIQWCPV